MPQEKPQRRIPVNIPGYRPFLVPAQDSANFAQAIRLYEAGLATPEDMSDIAYGAFIRQESIPHSPGFEARFRPIMEEKYGQYVGPPNPNPPQLSRPQENPVSRVTSQSSEDRKKRRAEMYRAATQAVERQPIPTQQDEQGFLSSALQRLSQQGERLDRPVLFDLVDKAGAALGGISTTRPGRPDNAEPWGPEMRAMLEHQQARPAVEPPPEGSAYHYGLAEKRYQSDMQIDDALKVDQERRQLNRLRNLFGLGEGITDEQAEYRVKAKELDELRRDIEAQRPTLTAQPGYEAGREDLDAFKVDPGAASRWSVTGIAERPPDTAMWDKSALGYAASLPGRMAGSVAGVGARTVGGAATLAALGAKAVGATDAQAELLQFGDFARQRAEEYAPEDVPSLQQLAKGQQPGSTARGVVDWVMNRGVAEGVASMLPMFAVGKGMMMAGAGSRAAMGGMAATSYVQNFGDVYDGLVEAGVDPDDALVDAALWTVPVAALDVVGVKGAAGDLLTTEARRKFAMDIAKEVAESRTRYAARGVARGVASEGPAEGGQEAIQNLAEIIHGGIDAPSQTRDPEQIAWRVLEAMTAGAIGGGLIGGGANLVNKPGEAEWDAALFQARDLGLHPDPARAAQGEQFERRRGYAQQIPNLGSAEVGGRTVRFPNVEFQRRASDPAVQAARGANLVPPTTQEPEIGPLESAPEAPLEDRRRPPQEIEQIFLDLAAESPDAVLNDISVLNVEGGFPDGVPREVVPALEERLRQLAIMEGSEEHGAKWRGDKLVKSGLNEEEQKEREALSWMLENVMPIARLRRQGEINEGLVEDRIKIIQAREGTLEEAPPAPGSSVVTPTRGTSERVTTKPPPVDERGFYEVPADRDATKYRPPPPGKELNRLDIIPEYVADINDVRRRDDVFQFRTTGLRSRGRGIPDEVEWSPAKAAQDAMWVWKDVEGELGDKGAIYVVDGHNRLDKAQRSGVPRVQVRFLNDAGQRTAQEAKVFAAFQNIRQEATYNDVTHPTPSTGLLFDAVTVLRESGMTAEQADIADRPLGRDAAAIASLPTAVYDNYRDQSIRSFADDAVYVALGEQGLSDAEVLALWKYLTDKKPGKDGFIRTPKGKTGVRGEIAGWVDFLRRGQPEAAQESEQTGLFGDAPEVEIGGAVWASNIIAEIKSRLNRTLELGKQFSGKQTAEAERRGIIQGADEEAAAQLTEQAKYALGQWELLQRDDEMRDKLVEWGRRFTKASRKQRSEVADEAWNEVYQRLFPAEPGVEGEGGAVVEGGETDAGTVAEAAEEYAAEEAPPVDEAVGRGKARRGAPMRFGNYEVRESPENGRSWIYDLRTGEIVEVDKKPMGFKTLSGARTKAAELDRQDRGPKLPPAQEKLPPSEATTTEEPGATYDPEDGPQPAETQPGPEPTTTEPAEAETGPEVIEDAEYVIEDEEAPDVDARDRDETFSGVWESADRPAGKPVPNPRQAEVLEILQSMEDPPTQSKVLRLPEGFPLKAMLLRNIARVHYLLSNPEQMSRDRRSEIGRYGKDVRRMLMEMLPAWQDQIQFFWGIAQVDPNGFLVSTHLQLLQDAGYDLNTGAYFNLDMLEKLRLIFNPSQALQFPPAVRGGQLLTAQTDTPRLGKHRLPYVRWVDNLADLLSNKNGTPLSANQLTGKKLDAALAFIEGAAEEIIGWAPEMSYTDAMLLQEVIGGITSTGESVIHKKVTSRDRKGKQHSAWVKGADGQWMLDPNNTFVRLSTAIRQRIGDHERVLTWFLNPEFGQAVSWTPSFSEMLAEKRHRVRAERKLNPERDLFNDQPEEVQGDLIEMAREQGIDLGGVDLNKAREDANRRDRREAEQFAEGMYDEWWESRGDPESPLTLKDKEKLLFGMKLLSLETGQTYRNTDDVWFLEVEVAEQRMREAQAKAESREPGNRVMSFENAAIAEAIAAQVIEEIEADTNRPINTTRRVLRDVAQFDNDPAARKRAEAIIGRHGRIKTLLEAKDMLEQALGVTARSGRHRFQGGVLGVFKTKIRAIRLRYEQDEEAAFHEFGHAFQWILFRDQAYTPSGNLSNKPLQPWQQELLPLAKGISSQDLVEGLAEFVRRYFNNPDSALKQAPQFYAFFERALKAADETLFEQVQDVRDQLLIYRNAGPRARLLANFTYEGQRGGLLSAGARAYRAAVDAFVPIETVARAVGGTEEFDKGFQRRGRTDLIDPFTSVEVMGRTLNGTNGMAEQWVRRGQVKLVNRYDASGILVLNPAGQPMVDIVTVGPSLEAILANVPKGQMQEFEFFATAKRVMERYHAPMLKAAKLAAKMNNQAGQANRYIPQEHPKNVGVVGVYDTHTYKWVKTFPRIEVMLNYADARAIVDDIKKNGALHATFQATMDELQTYRANLLQYLVDARALTPEAKERILEGSHSYVPLRPVPQARGPYRENRSTGFLGWMARRMEAERPHIGSYRIGHVPPGVYKQRGHSGPIMPPLEAIYRDTYEMLAVAHRARLAHAMFTLTEAHGSGRWLERVMTPAQNVPLPLPDALRQLKNLIPEDVFDELTKHINNAQMANEVLWAFKPAEPYGEKGMVSFIDNQGKRRWYEVKDKDLYEGLMAIEAGSHWALRLIFPSSPARWLRVGSTATPTFSVLRNPIRDIVMAGITSRHGLPGVPTFEHIRALVNLWHGEKGQPDEWYDRFIRGLGAFGAMVDFDRNSIQREIDKTGSALLGQGSVRWKSRNVSLAGQEFKVPLGYVVRDVGDQIRLLSALMENVTRMAEFKRAYETYTKSGYGTAEAEILSGFDARDVTVDFRRHGAATFAVRQGVAFWNANIQGWDKTIRSFKEDPRGTFLRSVMYITVPSVLLWTLNHDDEDYQELPQWVRDYFWLIPLPFGVEGLPSFVRDDYDPNMFVQAAAPATGRGRKVWIKAPKPFGLGTMFGTFVERALDMMAGEDSSGLTDAFKDMVTREIMGLFPIPTMWAPVGENITNHSVFFDRPIVPRRFEGVESRYHSEASTSSLANAVGDKLSLVPFGALDSPLKIDNLLYSWYGTAMRDALRVTDSALDALGLVERYPAGTLQFQRTPALRDLLQSNTQWTSRSVSRLYDLGQDPKIREGTMQMLLRRSSAGNPSDIREFEEYVINRTGAYSDDLMITAGLAIMSQLDRQRDFIDRNPNMSQTEKNAAIFELADYRTNLARHILRTVGQGD